MTTTSRLPEPDGQGGGANLADILERVLDKGIVMGIDWWEDDPALSSGARRKELAQENAELRERPARLETDPAQEEAS